MNKNESMREIRIKAMARTLVERYNYMIKMESSPLNEQGWWRLEMYHRDNDGLITFVGFDDSFIDLLELGVSTVHSKLLGGEASESY